MAIDFFELLGVPRSVEVDSAPLQKNYFDLQRKFHPDRFVGRSEEERKAVLEESAKINEAYETLKDPVKRAEHLMALVAAPEAKPSQAELMEIMEMKESGEAAEQAAKALRRAAEFFSAGDYAAFAHEVMMAKYLSRWSDAPV